MSRRPSDIEEFKHATLRKLESVRCAEHGRAPEVEFQGASLTDVAIRVRSCCDALSHMANAALAATAGPQTPPTLPR